jgi:hypothetical protein
VILGPSVMGQVEVRADDGDGGAPGPPLLSVPRGPGGGPDAIFFIKNPSMAHTVSQLWV